MRYSILPVTAVVLFAAPPRFQLEHSKDRFGVRSHGIIETLPSGRTKFYPLPQSTVEQYRRLRTPNVTINPVTADTYQRQEVIGPSQIEKGKIWFGNNFYDGEGDSGVGAFGYFDTTTRTYTLFSPPEVARWEISAILVQPETIWLGLDSFGEDISTSPGGLLRFNRRTSEMRRYPLEFGIRKITAEGDSLLFETLYGYAIFRDGVVKRFLSTGRQIAKYPPPPTNY
jgi:hypothetical protein